MASQSERIHKIKHDLVQISNQVPSVVSDPSANEIKKFISFWEDINAKMINFEQLLKSQSSNDDDDDDDDDVDDVDGPKDSDFNSDSVSKINHLIDAINSVIAIGESKLSFEIKSNEISFYENMSKNLKDFEKQFKNDKSYLDKLNDCLKENQNIPSDLKKKVDEINPKWLSLNDKLTSKINQIKKIIQNLTHICEEIKSINIWIDEAYLFLNENIAIGDIEVLENQLEQCAQLQSDIKQTLQLSVDNINKLATDMNNQFNIDNENQMKELNSKWNQVKDTANDKSQRLKDAIRNCKSVSDKIIDFEKWISDFRDEVEKLIYSEITDITEQLSKLKSMSERLALKKSQTKKLEIDFNIIQHDQLTTESYEEMKMKMFEIQNGLEECDKVIAKSIELAKIASSKYREMNRLIFAEKDWLDKLERKLKRSPQSAVDAEEISESLDVSLT